MSSSEKIYEIINLVKKDNLVVIEGDLSVFEQAELIETTMKEINVEDDSETFVGVNVNTLDKDSQSFLGRLKKKTVVTVIGPAKIVKTVEKHSNFLSMVAELYNEMFKNSNDEGFKVKGLELNFISSEALENMSSIEKIYEIIGLVKKGNLVVMEGDLSVFEQAELIEATMREIDVEDDNETFVGIDVNTLDKNPESFLGRLKKKTVVTVIGPAKLVKTVEKHSNFLSMVAEVSGTGS